VHAWVLRTSTIFHHLFITLRIRSDESATSFFRHVTFARSAAEAASNVYQKEELVNFALNAMSSTSNSKYEKALQLYNMQHDSGSTYMLAEIETKFFTKETKHLPK
jgi:hypothetical protein